MKYKHSRKKIEETVLSGITCSLEMAVFSKDYIIDILTMLLEPAEWPQPRDKYWYVGVGGGIFSQNKDGIYLNDWDEELEKFGNCFRTRKQAEKMRDKIKSLLKEI